MTVSIIMPNEDAAILAKCFIAKAIGYPVFEHVTQEHVILIYAYRSTAYLAEAIIMYNTLYNMRNVQDYIDENVEIEVDKANKLLKKYATPEVLESIKLIL